MARDTGIAVDQFEGLKRTALAAAGVGAWLLEPKRNEVEVDETLATLLELPQPRAQCVALDKFLDQFDGHDRARLQAQIAQVVDGGPPLNTAAVREKLHPDGGAVHLALRGRVISESDAEVPTVGGACWDITDTKRLERKLEQLSVRDSLTELYNRRYFDENIEREWKIGLREKLPLSLGFIDVDHFKAYNDSLGHQTGDRCLIRIANAIRSAVARPADFVARYGGEEFVFVLPATPTEGALNVARRVMETVASERIAHPDSPTSQHVTVSVGVATWTDPSAELPIHELIKRADDAVYAAKEQGRARIVQWSEDLPASKCERR